MSEDLLHVACFNHDPPIIIKRFVRFEGRWMVLGNMGKIAQVDDLGVFHDSRTTLLDALKRNLHPRISLHCQECGSNHPEGLSRLLDRLDEVRDRFTVTESAGVSVVPLGALRLPMS